MVKTLLFLIFKVVNPHYANFGKNLGNFVPTSFAMKNEYELAFQSVDEVNHSSQGDSMCCLL